MHETTIGGLRARRFCMVCGAPFVPPAAFCAACGASSGERPPVQPPERVVRADTPSNQAPATITITPAQFRILVPVVGLIAGFLVGQYVADNLLVSVPLALVGCFLGYTIALRAPGGSFEGALHEAAANVGSSVGVLVEPLRTARAGSPATGSSTGVRADRAAGVAAFGPDPAAAWPPTTVAYAQAAAVRPTAAPITAPTVVQAVAAVALLGALLLPWATVNGLSVGNFSLNGLGLGSFRVEAFGFQVAGASPSGFYDALKHELPSSLRLAMDILRLLPLLAGAASVALVIVLAASRRPSRRLPVGLVATVAGVAAIVASVAWFAAIGVVNDAIAKGFIQIASPDFGIALAFVAGLVLLVSGFYGRRRLTPEAVVLAPAEQGQQAYRRST